MIQGAIPFLKMHGCGNDYILLDAITHPRLGGDDAPWRARVRAMCDRRTGIGGDGVIVVAASDDADARAEVVNSDGSPGGMCGNGLRMVAKLLVETGRNGPGPVAIWMGGRIIEVAPQCDESGRVVRARADMGSPETDIKRLPIDTAKLGRTGGDWLLGGAPVTFVSMGNPHAVLFVDRLPESEELARSGPAYETAPAFPERMNIHWAHVLEPGLVEAVTWERGAGATRACGTGACAVCVAGVTRGLTEPGVSVRMPGGVLHAEWDRGANRLWLSGPVEQAFTGVWGG